MEETRELNLLSIPIDIFYESIDLNDLTDEVLRIICGKNGIKKNLSRSRMIKSLQKLADNDHPKTKYYGETWTELAINNKGKVIVAILTTIGTLSTLLTTIIVQVSNSTMTD